MSCRRATLQSLVWLLPLALVTSCVSTPPNDPNDVGGPKYIPLESATITSPDQSAALREPNKIKTAFVIVMENANWEDIAGSPSAPYINDVLLPTSAFAENYWDNPKHAHPSEPNYIWMEAGDNLGIYNDHEPSENYRNTKKHLTSLLQAAGVPWKFYQQGIDGTRCPLTAVGDYAPKHNAPIFFSDVTDNNNPLSANCIAHVRPESELATDLGNDEVSGYVFITPDRCHNMHDACTSGDKIKNGDDFLSVEIPKIQASAAYKKGGAIFVTWDESEGSEDQPIGMIVSSPFARAGYRSETKHDHSSLLRTMQEIFGVRPFLRDAENATSLSEMFTTFP